MTNGSTEYLSLVSLHRYSVGQRTRCGHEFQPATICPRILLDLIIRSLVIVIVNFRSSGLVIDAVESVQHACDDRRWGTVIVDNGSGDASVGVLSAAITQRGWSERTCLLESARNGGFGAGNNLGIQIAVREGAPVIWLLNPDTLVHEPVFDRVRAFFELHPEAGIVGTGLVDAKGEPDCAAHNDPSPLGELEGAAAFGPISRLLARWAVSPSHMQPRSGLKDADGDAAPFRCDWVSGASMFVRREVFEQIGGFDEGFFLYFEEVDLCRRARDAGWEVWHLPATRVVHLEGATTGINAPKRRRPGYWFDSRFRFYIKHGGVARLLAADACWLLGRCIRGVKSVLKWQPNPDPPHFGRDLLLGDLSALLTGRRRVKGSDNAQNPLPPKRPGATERAGGSPG